MTNNVFITGGSRGIGAAAVLAFARAGYNVAFTYNSHPDAADAVRRQAEEINPGGLYLAIRADAGDPAQVRAAHAAGLRAPEKPGGGSDQAERRVLGQPARPRTIPCPVASRSRRHARGRRTPA